MNEKISRILITIEAFAICLPISYLFIFKSLPASIYFLDSETFEPTYVTVFANILILIGIIAAWRLILSFMIYGNESLVKTANAWWVISFVVAIVAITSSLYTHLAESYGPSSFISFAWGVFLLPPFGHLLLERRRNKH